ALTALRLARDIRDTHGVPAVPIFWIEGEDHDWNEVRTCGLLDADLAPRGVQLGDLPGANEGPVAHVRLDDSITVAITELEAALQKTEFTPELAAGLRAAYTPGTGMADAFGRWLEAVLGPHGL